MPTVSVVTPTYERAATLPRLYRSLREQSYVDFDWVVIDDGSTDGTARLFAEWVDEAPFRIDYRRQENRGKHVAVNRGVRAATGSFCAVMDSDDWYAPAALARMVDSWEAIPAARRDEFANVEGLCAGPDGKLIGNRLPAPVLDSNTFEIAAVHGVRGDTVGMYRREILLDHPFPEDLGWHVMPALVWNRIAAHWSTRFVDEVWGYKEYLAGGLTNRRDELRMAYPEVRGIYWRELTAMPRPMPRVQRFRAAANHVRYGMLAGGSPWHILRESDRRALTAAALPVGAGLWARDRRRAGRAGRAR